MTIYVIAQIPVHDDERYGRYRARFMEVFQRFDGRLLVADTSPRVVEGEWNSEKLIVMSIPDEVSFQKWSNSPASQKISKDRKAGSKAVVLLAAGLAS